MFSRFFVWIDNPPFSFTSESNNLNSFITADDVIDIRITLKGYGWKANAGDQNVVIHHFGSYRCSFKKVGDAEFTQFARIEVERESSESTSVYKDVNVATGLIPKGKYEIKIVADRLEEFNTWTNGVVEGISCGTVFYNKRQFRTAIPNLLRGNELISVGEDVQIGLDPLLVSVVDTLEAIIERIEREVPEIGAEVFDSITVVDAIDDSETAIEVNVFEIVLTLSDFDGFFALVNLFDPADAVIVSEFAFGGLDTVFPFFPPDNVAVDEFFNGGVGGSEDRVIFPDDFVNITEDVQFEFITLFHQGFVFDEINIEEFAATTPFQPAIGEPDLLTIIEFVQAQFELCFFDEDFTDFSTLGWTEAPSANATVEISPAGQAHLTVDVAGFFESARLTSPSFDFDLTEVRMVANLKLDTIGTLIQSATTLFITIRTPNGHGGSIRLGADGIAIRGFNLLLQPVENLFFLTMPTGFFKLTIFARGGGDNSDNRDGELEVFIDDVRIGSGFITRENANADVSFSLFGTAFTTEVHIEDCEFCSFRPIGQLDIFVAEDPNLGEDLGILEDVVVTFDALFAHSVNVFDSASIAEFVDKILEGGDLQAVEEISVEEVILFIHVFDIGDLPLIISDDITIEDVDPPLLNIEKFFAQGDDLTGWDIFTDVDAEVVTEDNVFKLKKNGGSGNITLTRDLVADAVDLDFNDEHHFYVQFKLFMPVAEDAPFGIASIEVIGADAGSDRFGFRFSFRHNLSEQFEFIDFGIVPNIDPNIPVEVRVELTSEQGGPAVSARPMQFKIFFFNELFAEGIATSSTSARRIKVGFITGSNAATAQEIQISEILAGAINVENQLRYVASGEDLEIEEFIDFAIISGLIPLDVDLFDTLSLVENLAGEIMPPGFGFDNVSVEDVLVQLHIVGTKFLYLGSRNASKIFKLEAFTTTVVDSFTASTLGSGCFGLFIKDGDTFIADGNETDKYNGFSNSFNSDEGGGNADITFIGGDLVQATSNVAVKRYSGFSNTVIDSIATDFGVGASNANGIHWDGTNLLISSSSDDKFYRMNGFSESILDSFGVPGGGGSSVLGLAQDDKGDTLAAEFNSNKIFRLAGFSATILDSITHPGTQANGVAWFAFLPINLPPVDDAIVVTEFVSADIFFLPEINVFDTASVVSELGQVEEGPLPNLPSVFEDIPALQENVDLEVVALAEVLAVLLTPDTVNQAFLLDEFAGSVTDSINVGFSPRGVAVIEQDMILTDDLNDKIKRYDGFSTTIIDSIASAKTFVGDCDFGDGEDGNLYTGELVNDKFFKHQGFSTTILDSFSALSSDSNGIAIRYGIIYTTDNVNDKCYKHNGFSNSIADSFDTPTSGPQGMHVDRGENVWIVDSNFQYKKHAGFSATITDSFTLPGFSQFSITEREPLKTTLKASGATNLEIDEVVTLAVV